MPLTAEQIMQQRYRVEGSLGEGGMGAVYRAWDQRLQMPVALKELVPQPGLDAETLAQLRQQFEQEAIVLARLKHPHLVSVIDFFEENGFAYLVMEFIEGESLAERIEREGALPEEQVLTWARQLLLALAYCHEQGILHRDVKPQNVVITPDGDAVLVDFGLVKLWDPDDRRTRTAIQAMGTPEYAPPEQYSLRARHTNPSSDLYSLGATLYHALTGTAPLSATDRMASPRDFKAPTELRSGVHPHVEAAILKALTLSYEDRFQDASTMLDALEGKAPSEAPGPSAPKRAWRYALAGVGIVILLAIGLLWNRLPLFGATTPTPTPSPSPTETTPPTATSSPTDTVEPTATHTEEAGPTSTPRQTEAAAIATTAPTTGPTATPRPVAPAAPTLVAPQRNTTLQSPVTFQWEGQLYANQTFLVTGRNTRTGYTHQSPPLQTTSWTTDLPGTAYGEWKWTVSVIQGEQTIAVSDESTFWFDPFPGGGGGGENGDHNDDDDDDDNGGGYPYP